MLTLGNFSDFFLVCKLHKLGLYIATYFGHGQCFVWEFLALIFIEIAKQKTTPFSNFSWSGNDTILACKLYMSIRIKILILSMSEIFGAMLMSIGINLYLLLKIFYHKYTAIAFGTILFDFLWRLWKLLFFE